MGSSYRFLFSNSDSVSTDTGNPDRGLCLLQCLQVGVSGKIITPRFDENMLLAQTIHDNGATGKFFSEKE